jgi:hypothetical protein
MFFLKKKLSLSSSQEAFFLSLYKKGKSTKNVAFHDFSTHFYIGTTREVVLLNNFLEKLFFEGSVF